MCFCHCVDICTDGAKSAASRAAGPLAQARAGAPDWASTHTHSQKRAGPLQNVLDEHQYYYFINFQCWVHVFLTFCLKKWRTCLKHPLCPKWGCLGQSACALAGAARRIAAPFFMEQNDWQANCGYLDSGIWQIVSWKCTRWACHFKESSQCSI